MSDVPASPPAVTMSQADYARHRGVSRAAVSKAVRAGRIPLTRERRIDPVVADVSWRANTDPSKPSNTVLPALPQVPEGAPMPDQPPPLSYADSRALREYNLARLAELEYRLKSGQLVEVDEVRDIAFRASRSARDLILAAPARLAPRLVGVTDQGEIFRILQEDLARACEELVKVEVIGPEAEQVPA